MQPEDPTNAITLPGPRKRNSGPTDPAQTPLFYRNIEDSCPSLDSPYSKKPIPIDPKKFFSKNGSEVSNSQPINTPYPTPYPNHSPIHPTPVESYAYDFSNQFGQTEANPPCLFLSGCGDYEIQIMQFNLHGQPMKEYNRVHEDAIYCISSHDDSFFTSDLKGT
jgi:hypothetical protein